MALIRANSGSSGGGTLTKVGAVTATPSSAKVCTFDLSSINGASNFVLFENMIPVIKEIAHSATNTSKVSIQYDGFTYDNSTKRLTLTLGGNTSYVKFATTGTSSVDIYALT